MERGKSVQRGFNSGISPLFWAIYNSDLSMVRALIDQGIPVNGLLDGYGISPLHWAAYNGDVEIILMLIASGADVDQESSGRYPPNRQSSSDKWSCETPLHWSMYSCDINIMFILIEQGADINKKDCRGESILYKALYNCDEKILEWLFEKNADDKFRSQSYGYNSRNASPLFYIAMKNGNEEIAKMIIKKYFDVDMKDELGNKKSPLHLAAYSGSAETVEMLINQGANVNALDEFSWTPLHWVLYKDGLASRTNDVNSLKTSNSWPYGKTTSLHLAASEGHVKVVRFLVEKGADVNILDERGRKALHIAAIKGYVEIVRLLED